MDLNGWYIFFGIIFGKFVKNPPPDGTLWTIHHDNFLIAIVL